MDTADMLAIIGAVGGVQGLLQLLQWWFSRKATLRQGNAAAQAAENENNRKQVEWLEKRIAERDTKIDGLYAELRQEQAARLEEIHRRHEVELRLAEAEVRKCLKRRCSDREPPSDY